jgi:hypothetical protein
VVQRPVVVPPLARVVGEPTRPPIGLTVMPPALRPLPVVRDRPRSPLDSMLTEEPRREPTPSLDGMPTRVPRLDRTAEPDTHTTPGVIGKPTAPPLPEINAPAGKALDGMAIQVNPLLGAGKLAAGERTALPAPVGLAPDAVLRAPALAPLATNRGLDRGLLPTLDAEDRSELEALDDAVRGERLGLVLEPPALPPLPDTILR